MSCRRLLPFAIVLLCATVPLSFADQVVYFVNGKAIMVKSVEKGEKFTILEMEGGGKVGVPTDQISKIEDFAITAPQAIPAQSAPVPAAVAPIVAAGPAPAAAPPAVASGLPTDPSMAAGPGIGGRPAGGPNDNLAHIKPLDISGNSGAGPIQRPYPQATAGPGAGRPGGPMLGMAARQSLAAGRRFGRGMNGGGGRGGRPGMVDAARTTPAPQTPPVAPQPQVTQPPPADPPPAPAVEPEAAPAPPDDSNEEPSDAPAPEEGDSSGNTPGSAR
jgi:hypothetical protein